ncbi:AAA family ATPase [Clostridium sp. AL.422]|uniref:AAA family ATPase n=1 Tax=Clostridium TaxID=1485 RepID=UPI00293DFDB7|nr:MULTISPECIES: AAA family ATPase [unclassified Clostridium]MDV4151313.1 AAA family ATPase [Clostridium sp. AL.422]
MTLKNGIYIITGIMASGKSTIAQMLAEQFDKGVHIRGDIFRKMIVNGKIDMTPNYSKDALEQLILRYNIAAKVADMYYDAGFSVVMQDTYLAKELPSFFLQFQSKPIYFITLNPSIETVIEREEKRNKIGYATWEVEPLYEVLINENPRIGLWIDSSAMTPEETVLEIIKRAEYEARIL